MKNITNNGEALRTQWKITEGFPGESGYEPDDEADKGSRNKEVNRVATTNSKHTDKTGDSRRMLRNWSGLGQRSNLKQLIVTVTVWEIRKPAPSLNEVL